MSTDVRGREYAGRRASRTAAATCGRMTRRPRSPDGAGASSDAPDAAHAAPPDINAPAVAAATLSARILPSTTSPPDRETSTAVSAEDARFLEPPTEWTTTPRRRLRVWQRGEAG